MQTRKPTATNWALLVFLGVIWGGSFPAVKVALTGFEPLTVAALRIALAAVVLLILAYVFGEGLPKFATPRDRRVWLHCLGMAIFTNAVPFTLLSWAQLYVSAGFAGITMAVVPLMVLPLAHFLIPGERLGPKKLVGFAVGFVGVIILIGPQAFLSSGADLENLARLASLGATAGYAIGSIITRLAPSTPQLTFSAGALLLASLIMLPTAYLVEGLPVNPPVPAILAIAYLGLVPTALATVILVRIIAQVGPSFLSLVNYQVPVWATIMGIIFLSESLPTQFIGALALILLGLGISQAKSWQRFRT
ncbi:MAG: DMT family transporter [Alphaproteobacteria bacterium]|nr:DMT family transporter [Alphaproteobacteria bacterium]